MASKTETVAVEDIEENFLECGICLQNFHDPRGLPCLHAFCFECLGKWAGASGDPDIIICPMCKTKAEIPAEGVKGFPAHLMVKNLQETLQEQGDLQKVNCSNCNGPNKEANFHCFDCKEDLCEACHTNHNTFKIMKDHKVVTMEDLQSGKETDEGRICKEHGEKFRYYCETDKKQVCQDCVSLKTVCPLKHDRCSLKEAAKKQTAIIEELITKCYKSKGTYQDAVKKSDDVYKVLKKAEDEARRSLEKAKKEHINQIDKSFQECEDEITKVDKERTKVIADKKEHLEKQLIKIEEMIKQSSLVIESRSDYKITYSYASIVDSMEKLNQSKSIVADESLGYLKLQTFTPVSHVMDNVSVAELWKLTGGFKNISMLKYLLGITINQDGDIATSSGNVYGVNIFTKTGKVKYKFKNCNTYVNDIAVTPDNRYVITGNSEFQCYDSQGNQLSKIPTFDMNDTPSPSTPTAVAVDTKGRIAAGLGNNTISMHHADGTFINKFATRGTPNHLAVTSDEELVVCFNKTVQLINYSGGNVRDIQPPPDLRWSPGHVCCNHKYGEIFVVNIRNRNKAGSVYRYTSKGEYIGPVTPEISCPKGIAVSEDGQELFVAEHSARQVNIFTRQ